MSNKLQQLDEYYTNLSYEINNNLIDKIKEEVKNFNKKYIKKVTNIRETEDFKKKGSLEYTIHCIVDIDKNGDMTFESLDLIDGERCELEDLLEKLYEKYGTEIDIFI